MPHTNPSDLVEPIRSSAFVQSIVVAVATATWWAPAFIASAQPHSQRQESSFRADNPATQRRCLRAAMGQDQVADAFRSAAYATTSLSLDNWHLVGNDRDSLFCETAAAMGALSVAMVVGRDGSVVFMVSGPHAPALTREWLRMLGFREQAMLPEMDARASLMYSRTLPDAGVFEIVFVTQIQQQDGQHQGGIFIEYRQSRQQGASNAQ